MVVWRHQDLVGIPGPMQCEAGSNTPLPLLSSIMGKKKNETHPINFEYLTLLFTNNIHHLHLHGLLHCHHRLRHRQRHCRRHRRHRLHSSSSFSSSSPSCPSSSSSSSPSLASPRRKDRTLGTTMPTIVRESMRHAIFKSASRG